MRLAHTLHEAGHRRPSPDGVRLQTEAAPLDPALPLYDALYQRLCQREALVDIRTQERNRLHALRQWPEAQWAVVDRYEAHLAFLTEHIDHLQREIEQLLQSTSDWATTTHCLLSIPGIGPITTAWLLVATLNFTTCDTVEQLVAFAGLAPYPQHSDTSLHRTRGVGRGGHARLRATLSMAAVASLRSNPVIRHFYARLRQHGKTAKVALCACARKLLHLAWAVDHETSGIRPWL